MGTGWARRPLAHSQWALADPPAFVASPGGPAHQYWWRQPAASALTPVPLSRVVPLVKGGPGQSKPQRTVLWLRVSDGASSLTSIVAAEHVHGIEAAVNTAALVPMLHTDEVLHSSAHCRTSASSQ